MLTPEQRWKVVACCSLSIVIMVLAIAHGLRGPVSLQLTRIQPGFDAASALEYTKTLALGYPDRVTGTPGAARAADYIGAEFEKQGYKVSTDLFSMWLAGKRVEGRNVMAELPGDIPETLAVIAHYDGQFTSHQAAEDNASGVGVMLELARTLHSQPHHRGIIFVATDAEEWGMIGARALRGFLQAQKTVAVISIDYLTQGRAIALEMGCQGQRGGYTPLWLREIVEQSALVQGVQAESPSGIQEWIERSLEVSPQDQGPLLRVGIPAVNLSTISPDDAAVRARYHSAQDVFENFEPATFQMVGGSVEQAISTLNTLEGISPHEMKYLRLASGRWIDRTTIEWVQILGLLPFIAACVLAVMNFEVDDLVHPLWSYLRPAIYMVPLMFALFSLRGMASGGVLTRYELYPATPKDPFSYRIPLRVVIPLLAVLLLGYVAVRLVRIFLPEAPQSFAAAKRILCVWMYVAVIGTLYLDPYAVWFLLCPLAYGFLLLQRPSSLPRCAFNAVLLLAGALPFVALLYAFGREIFLGWRIVWYLVLQTAYGVWSTFAAILFLTTLALWVQLFRLAVLGLPVGVRREVSVG